MDILCIICPNGCLLKTENSTEGLKITGNLCKKGIDFAYEEINNPVRTLCTTIATSFPEVPVLPVRTSGEIPKSLIMETMKIINAGFVDKPLGIGEIVIKNIHNSGIDIIITSNILKELYG